MADRPRAQRNEGVTIAPGASPGKSLVLLALALGLACLALLVLFGRPAPEPGGPAPLAVTVDADATREDAPVAAPPAAEPETQDAAAPTPEPEQREPPRPQRDQPVPDEPAPAADEAPTVPSGIGLFPPPGTDPIKVGIVVPEDFELPEGYLRHYQVMDDGRELPPILLFHPDYELLDDAGDPIPLPADRVVPPELAPPGLPIEPLVVPPPLEEP